jgi:protein O-mannosyl-transferase
MSAKWSRALPIVCLVAVTWLVFWQAARASFVLWDDADMVFKNPDLNPPSWDKTAGFWHHPVLGLYSPLPYTAWSAVAAMENVPPDTDLRPGPFHLLNLLIHTAAVVLVFALLKELGAGVWPAWAGAALFAIHPLQVEPVAWVGGMNNLLCGVFCIAALWQYLIYAKAARGGGWHYAAATVFFAAALACKPIALMLPAVAAAIDLGIVRRPLSMVLPPMCLWAAMAFQGATIARTAQPSAQAAATPWADKAMVAVDAVGFYSAKLVAPVHLAMDYERTPAWVVAHRTEVWRGALVLLAGVIVCLFRGGAWLRIPLAVALLALIPVLGLAAFDFQYYSTVADRYMYLPMVGVAMAAAGALQKFRGAGARTAAGIVLVLLAGRSMAQIGVWRDTAALAANESAIYPDNSTADMMLGGWYYDSGRFPEAEQEFEQGFAALKSEGKRVSSLDILYYGEILQAEGRDREAVAQYQLAIPHLTPLMRAEACNGLGVALYHLGDVAGAREQFKAAIKLRPDLGEAQRNLQRIGAD